MEINLSPKDDPKSIKLYNLLLEEQRSRYACIFKEYLDVFTWKYEYLNTYDIEIIQHRIPLKPDAKPVKKKMRQVNSMLLPVIVKEVKKSLDDKIILPLSCYDWVDNI